MKPELIKTLLKVQSELPVIGRTTKAYNYKYTPLEDVWEKVGKILTDNGFVISNQIELAGVHTFAYHEHGTIESFVAFSHVDLKPQDRGSEITYARRYNLTAMFNIIIADEDDDGQTAQKGTSKVTDAQKAGTGKATAKQLKFIRDLLDQKGYTEKQMEIKYDVTNIDQLTFDQASEAITRLTKAPVKPKQTKIEEDIDVDEIDKEINK